MRLSLIAVLLFTVVAACGGSGDSAPAPTNTPQAPANTPTSASGGASTSSAASSAGGDTGGEETEKTGSVAGYGVGAGRSLPTIEGNIQAHQLSILNFAHEDATVKVGTTVVWYNLDGTSHTTTSGRPEDADAGALWDSGNLLYEGVFSQAFDQAGEFPYMCTIHNTMQGTITVTE